MTPSRITSTHPASLVPVYLLHTGCATCAHGARFLPHPGRTR